MYHSTKRAKKLYYLKNTVMHHSTNKDKTIMLSQKYDIYGV